MEQQQFKIEEENGQKFIKTPVTRSVDIHVMGDNGVYVGGKSCTSANDCVSALKTATAHPFFSNLEVKKVRQQRQKKNESASVLTDQPKKTGAAPATATSNKKK